MRALVEGILSRLLRTFERETEPNFRFIKSRPKYSLELQSLSVVFVVVVILECFHGRHLVFIVDDTFVRYAVGSIGARTSTICRQRRPLTTVWCHVDLLERTKKKKYIKMKERKKKRLEKLCAGLIFHFRWVGVDR